MLLSEGVQAKLAFVKDMSAGTVWLQDQNDYLQVYRAKGSDVKVICLSHFPTLAEHLNR